MAKIKRTDRLVVLRVNITLRLDIGGLSPVLGECRQGGTVFLVLEQKYTFVEKGFRIVVSNMFLR